MVGLVHSAFDAAAQSNAATGPVVELLQADETRIAFEWSAPPPRQVPVDEAGEARVRLKVDGMASPATTGALDLPVAAVLVGLPPVGTPRLVVRERAVDEVRLAAPPARVGRRPPRTARPDLEGNDDVFAVSLTFDPRDVPAVATLSHVGWLRGQRVARVALAPFLFDGATGRLRFVRRMQVVLEMAGAAGPTIGRPEPAAGRDVSDTTFDAVLDASLVNGPAARAWRVARGPWPAGLPTAATPPSEAGDVWNLEVDAEGMQRLRVSDLVAAGFDVTGIDPRHIALYEHGEPVAIRVVGEADGVLDVDDEVIFYGRPARTRYATAAVYQLAVGSGPGSRMATSAAAPEVATAGDAFSETIRLDRDQFYRSDLPRTRPGEVDPPGVDRWYAAQLSAPEVRIERWSAPDVASGAAVLRLALVGKSALDDIVPDHELRVLLNGTWVGTLRWDGNNAVVTPTIPLPAGLPAFGELAVTLEATGGTAAEYDQFLVDWLELTYPRRFVATGGRLAFGSPLDGRRTIAVSGYDGPSVDVFDVSDPRRPMVLTGVAVEAADGGYRARIGVEASSGRRYEALNPGGYRAPSIRGPRPRTTLLSPPAGADYLVVAPIEFHAALAPLVAHREASGLRAAVVDLQSVYDAFGGGTTSADAIRAFAAHAYHHWPGQPPSHLLLVGDGNYDPRNRLGDSPPSLLPPYLAVVDPWLGEVASENAYATVAGEDPFPDLFVGRLPVRSAAETAAVVAKILAYETVPPAGDWPERLLFAADDADAAGNFPAISDAVIGATVPGGYEVTRVYLGQTHADAEAARRALLAELNRGALLTQYVGHGLIVGWAQELVVRRADMAALTNGGRLPVMLDMTCMTGYFIDPRLTSIAEEAVRVPNGGAIAAFSPTGFGVATGHDILNRTFLEALLGRGVNHLGQLMVLSKLRLGSQTSAYDDLLATFAILGDPALRVAVRVVGPPVGTPPTAGAPTSTPAASETAEVPPTTAPPVDGQRVWLPLTYSPQRR